MTKRQTQCFLLASAAAVSALATAPASAQVTTAPIGSGPPQTSSVANVPAPAAGQAAADSQPSIGVTDIIVTANRRAERAQDVPISITAFSPQRLQQQNITQPQDLQASVPSLVVGANGQASRDSQTFTLRGQGATFQASPGVVVYMNEVPLPAPITLSQQGGPGNFVDLENLQVLAGPQGTLFGRNTTGGAILLVPHKPTNTLSGSVLGKYGNYNDKEIEGVINVPIVDDKLLVRAVGAYHDRDGFTKDLTFNRRLDNTHWYSGRIGVTFRPSDRFENYLLAYGSYSKFNGTGQKLEAYNIAGLSDQPGGVGFCTDTGLPGGLSGFAVPCDYYRGLVNQSNSDGPRRTRPSVRQGQKTETWGIEDTARFNLNDNLLVRNIISYQRFKSSYYYDGDASPTQQYDASVPIAPLTPRDDLQVFTEELQLQGTYLDKHLLFTVGGFYYDQKPSGRQSVRAIVYCPAIVTIFGGSCPASTQTIKVENESKALYAQATLDLGVLSPSLESLRITGGYRYTWDTITGSAVAFSPSRTVPGAFTCTFDNATVTNPQTGCQFGATLHSKAPNWTIGVDYKPVRNLLVFAKVSRGYKAGGFNSYSVSDGSIPGTQDTRTFDPEFVTSYEAGFKSDFRIAGMPTRLNASYYFLNYSNIQKATGDFNQATLASGARINAAKAHVKGVEVEASIRPWKYLELGGTFSWTGFKYTKYRVASTGLLFDCSGTIPTPGPNNYDSSCLKGQYIAPYIFSIHAAVNVPISEEAGNLSFFINYAHNAAQHTEAVVAPAKAQVGPLGQQPFEKLAAFGLLSASLDWNNIYRSGIDAGVFVTNATNKLYRISNSDVFQKGSLLTAATIYGEPRMYGLKLRYHFGGE